ncbi:hypothetical protein PVL29_016019 [Vitis rotundifolia]|uniref:Uncharacterized protein n=1 Tax=Vitis rotundifolia TaxID=103349 RepID=A0AA38ZE48_VITRO|nr:hypothetical protein PVL29_016019 [Vitis rotundifolia]
MHSKFSITHLNPSKTGLFPLFPHRDFCKVGFSARPKLRFKLVVQSLGDRWRLSDIDTNAVQEQLNMWLVKTQSFLNEVTSPLVRTGHGRKPDPANVSDTQDMDDVFVAEQTIQSSTPSGDFSLAAIVSIEQFSRMNGLTGGKMQKIFRALVPETVYNDARNLVEYCCFRFLSRDSSDIHPCLKEPAFQRLIFITMLAWENPYHEANDSNATGLEKASFQRKLVGEEAFVRIAPAVSGVADRPTAHNLFKALAGDERGISLSLWCTYVKELLKVHEGRKSYEIQESPQLSRERIICIGSSRKRPVIKWENNVAWSKTWVLEFVDLGGEMRRDVWYAFINEVIALYKFINEYGPEDGDQSVFHVYGAHKGKERAIISAMNSIARLQALQFIRKLLDDPTKLVQFSYLQNAPYGDIVLQTLAVNYWGGQLVTKFKEAGYLPDQGSRSSDDVFESSNHVFDIDGSVYFRKWMRSASWVSSSSVAFWKNASIKQGVVLSKNLVVADTTLVERAAVTCKHKYQVVEKTQATIDAAMLKGIPSNIDLFKELILPLTVTAKNFEKLRRWEEPHLTVSFLAFAYTLIVRNLLPYVFPTTLMIVAFGMLLLKGLKEQGRLGRSFGKVTIRDQPPSNTIQKIIAVKEAMRDVENYLQSLNVTLLKIRTIILSGQPQVTTEVALVLLGSATILLVIPFNYVLGFVILDLFTRELDFRREMAMRFIRFLKGRWDTVPAAPVAVIPFESDDSWSKELKTISSLDNLLHVHFSGWTCVKKWPALPS